MLHFEYAKIAGGKILAQLDDLTSRPLKSFLNAYANHSAEFCCVILAALRVRAIYQDIDGIQTPSYGLFNRGQLLCYVSPMAAAKAEKLTAHAHKIAYDAKKKSEESFFDFNDSAKFCVSAAQNFAGVKNSDFN